MNIHHRLTSLASALLFAGVSSLALAPVAAQAAAPFAKVAAPGFYRLQLGAFEVTALNDGTVDLPVDQLLRQSPDVTRSELAAQFLGTPLETSANAYLINTGKKLILIDTGAGALFGPTLGKLAANLRASGYHSGQVDAIYLTHLHPDHVGGLAANAARLFPNAIVHADRHDVDYWLNPQNLKDAPADAKGFFQGAVASLQPYRSAGRLHSFERDGELETGITAVSSYGHTAGHTSYLIESEGKRLLIGGDLINVGPVQLPDPGVATAFDSDGAAAAVQRRSALTQAAHDGVLVAAAHMPFPGLGHVRAAGTGFDWVPVNYTRMR
jgi:glyoxylase-like metal-dependent hydrolase (beta-lactamase superfamily II)